jgi:hypothetical protein
MVLSNPVIQLYYRNFGESEGVQREFPLFFLIKNIKKSALF